MLLGERQRRGLALPPEEVRGTPGTPSPARTPGRTRGGSDRRRSASARPQGSGRVRLDDVARAQQHAGGEDARIVPSCGARLRPANTSRTRSGMLSPIQAAQSGPAHDRPVSTASPARTPARPGLADERHRDERQEHASALRPALPHAEAVRPDLADAPGRGEAGSLSRPAGRSGSRRDLAVPQFEDERREIRLRQPTITVNAAPSIVQYVRFRRRRLEAIRSLTSPKRSEEGGPARSSGSSTLAARARQSGSEQAAPSRHAAMLSVNAQDDLFAALGGIDQPPCQAPAAEDEGRKKLIARPGINRERALIRSSQSSPAERARATAQKRRCVIGDEGASPADRRQEDRFEHVDRRFAEGGERARPRSRGRPRPPRR